MKKQVTAFLLFVDIIFVCLLLFVFSGIKRRIVNEIKPMGKVTIVMLGNSLTYGGDWDILLKRDDVKNRGYPGFTVGQLLGLLEETVYKHDPEICFIEGGINDISEGIPVEVIFQNLTQIVLDLKSKNIIPVLQLTFHVRNNPKENEQVDLLNNLVRGFAEKNKIEHIDMNPDFTDEHGLKKDFTTDGTHLTEIAYLVWSKEVNKKLVELGIH